MLSVCGQFTVEKVVVWVCGDTLQQVTNQGGLRIVLSFYECVTSVCYRSQNCARVTLPSDPLFQVRLELL